MSSVFHDYEPYKGEIPKRATGSLVAFETGEAVTYGLYNAQERGELFITAGTPVRCKDRMLQPRLFQTQQVSLLLSLVSRPYMARSHGIQNS